MHSEDPLIRGEFLVSREWRARRLKRHDEPAVEQTDSQHPRPRPRLQPKNVRKFMDELFGDSMHACRVIRLPTG